MVRIIIKGGVWRNTEDEILKAAISKYGKNQWARISSLLVRKTPKQCKARWYEWLDPSIKKVEWSKTEDEKLLHLAKLMPTQWRTIAPIVGRTATQCLERYQKLLDDAEAKDNEELGLGAGENLDGQPSVDVRGLRPGEIDTDPETRAARPDPIDMDDDEKEMLSEARARLANTQGKKAKRKARERQLEEARRLAFLQKKRELKAAGINLRAKTKKKGMDYNADIPFEKQPQPGFYDVTDERSKVYAAPVGQSLKALEGKRKQELDEIEEKKKKSKGNDGKSNQTAQFVAAREAQIKKLKEQEQIIRRRKLNLPVPQVGEAELEDIVKIGQAGESARELVTGGNDATGRLLGDYESLGQARMARTPRTAQQEDNIMAEARNLRNMTAQQTPLLGEENTPLHGQHDGTGFESATPRHGVAATPNPLATPARGGMSSARGIGSTPARTPHRDNLSINDGDSVYGETPREEKIRLAATRRALQAGFKNLPAPENNFELAEDEEEPEEEEPVVMTEEDAAERDARLKAARELEEKLELERRSSVVKRGLPRPANVDVRTMFKLLNEAAEDLTSAVQMINFEMANLMRHDSLAHPIPGTSTAGVQISEYDMPEDEYVASAKSAIHHELALALGLPGANDEQLRVVIGSNIDESAFEHDWASERAGMVYSPSTSAWVDSASLSPPELSAAYLHMIQGSRDRMIAESTRALKAEKKLAKQLGGYQALNAKARNGITEIINEIHATQRDLETFSMLRVIEEAAAPSRLEKKREEVAVLERRERDLQAQYAEMNDERRALQESIDQLEEDKVVLAAQAALDAQGGEEDGDEEKANGE
ncbi:pre-mRNA splicing factor component-domain-containing protein [Kockovaella imperatae]|uniref:Pre-mRNA-splicing factor CEF1 n=1 Tax=Kockovaella imperatae TaxID=4999 RepID=A0A1Y1U9I6_9TREE|nr:pre-mRNA splicing factor component-domain-containing protein [Kockovaella imperatae]ORX34693.1 pre-mRNA splicing factor component-domain-containing protein [Kockovaella imperatae]